MIGTCKNIPGSHSAGVVSLVVTNLCAASWTYLTYGCMHHCFIVLVDCVFLDVYMHAL
jgi:hypothetical protein